MSNRPSSSLIEKRKDRVSQVKGCKVGSVKTSCQTSSNNSQKKSRNSLCHIDIKLLL